MPISALAETARLTSQELANLALQAWQDARRSNDAELREEALRLADIISLRGGSVAQRK